ncbi:hypothetical protein JCM1393_02550 [Clostridium carnis]
MLHWDLIISLIFNVSGRVLDQGIKFSKHSLWVGSKPTRFSNKYTKYFSIIKLFDFAVSIML